MEFNGTECHIIQTTFLGPQDHRLSRVIQVKFFVYLEGKDLLKQNLSLWMSSGRAPKKWLSIYIFLQSC